MRRSRNFLRYTNIRQRQKSERRGEDTQAKCPILPDNLRLHFFLFFPPMAGKNSAVRDPSDRPGRRPPAGLLRWNRCCRETGQATRSLDELFSSSLFSPQGGSEKHKELCGWTRLHEYGPPLTNTHFPPSSPPLSVRAEIGQRNLCLSCTGRARTNTGLLWPLISRPLAAPVPARVLG